MNELAPETESKKIRILITDDERNIRNTLALYLESIGCEVVAVATGELALAALKNAHFDLLFLDLKLRDENGLDLIHSVLAISPSISIVILTAYATLDTAVEAVKRGAWDYLAKPFSPEQILGFVERIREAKENERLLNTSLGNFDSNAPDIELTTRSAKMHAVLESLNRAAHSDATVLLRGENGTGKTILARMMHLRSARKGAPFVVVNCPTLSEELLASELFGHTKGAFTGAIRDQQGKVEAAEGGTLFLDEIGEITASIQAKLLRFLQDRQFERLGESRTRRADVRIVTATNRDLESDVQSGRFREDLLYRLNVVEVQVPSLRERVEDIMPLARRFLAFFAKSMGRPLASISKSAEHVLLNYAWPGNVRELRNTMERAMILWPTRTIEPEAFPERMQTADVRIPSIGGDFTLEEIERSHIIAVLSRKPRVEECAATLGIDVSTLWRKRKKYDETSSR